VQCLSGLTIYNPCAQLIYFPSRPGYTDPLVRRRVLDYLLFMNSKVGLL